MAKFSEVSAAERYIGLLMFQGSKTLFFPLTIQTVYFI